MITGDEKWIVYNNIKRKEWWGSLSSAPKATLKAGLHPKKVLLSIWCDWEGIASSSRNKVYCN